MSFFGGDGEYNRFQTMSLQSPGPCSIPNSNKRNAIVPDRATNDISDIVGAAPKSHPSATYMKPNSYQVSDIAGTRPMPLHRGTNSVDYTLLCDDIEGARPRGMGKPEGRRSNNPVDPLTPAYILPSYKMYEEPAPKFLRDTLDTADIDGTRSKPLYRFPQRENFDVTDIEGTTTGWKPRHKRVLKEGAPRDVMQVADINLQGVVKNVRCTDPLRPVHFINGMVVADDLKHTMPRKLPPARDGPFYSLTTADIEGAWPGWKPPHAMQPPLEKRRHFRNTNFVADIVGAQADTVAHCIRTKRETNPLDPAYVDLDGKTMVTGGTPSGATGAGHGEHRAVGQGGNQSSRGVDSVRALQETIERSAMYEMQDREMKAAQRQQQQQQRGGNQQQDSAAERRIRELEAEVASLRSSRGGGSSSSALLMSGGFRAPDAGSATQYRTMPDSARQDSGRQDSGRRVVMGSTPSSERLVLRSSDGRPRVSDGNLSAREVRAQRAYEEEVRSVRDL